MELRLVTQRSNYMTQETKCMCGHESLDEIEEGHISSCPLFLSQDWRIRERERWLSSHACLGNSSPIKEEIADYWLERISIILEEKVRLIGSKKGQIEEKLYNYDAYPHSDKQADEIINYVGEIIRGTEK